MLQVSWKDRKNNAWIRQKVGITVKQGLLSQLKKRKISLYGHWKRRPDSIVQITIEGEVEGKARPGRRKTGWIDNIRMWTNGGMAVAREKARKRMPTGYEDYGNAAAAAAAVIIMTVLYTCDL
ncbi:uncharacterized protein [Amphiura filiformis]|uniref:uncharacterized protein n=1 Tax=Amphiura filiformis TaxID=82378 RepID=UPI003B21D43A